MGMGVGVGVGVGVSVINCHHQSCDGWTLCCVISKNVPVGTGKVPQLFYMLSPVGQNRSTSSIVYANSTAEPLRRDVSQRSSRCH